MNPGQPDPNHEVGILRSQLAEADEVLRAIRLGEIDALVVERADGNQIYTLHSAEEPYRHLVEQMQEGALLINRSGDILYANAGFATLVGEPLESMVGSRVGRFVTAADCEVFELLLREGTGRRRLQLVRADGRAFEASLSLTAPRASGDRLNLIVTDFSALVEAGQGRDRAERDSRAKDSFLALVAHELRNPLGAISNAVRLIVLTNQQGGPTADAAGIITRQVAHVTYLINELLDVERVVSGKIRLDRRPLDLAEAVARSAASFIGNADLDRTFELTTEPLWVEADAVRLMQIIDNVLTNAVKYTDPGGTVRVDLRADDGDAVLVVEDTGAGISSRLMPFIFEPYVQAERTLNRAKGGLGLGLTLVRRLVELHGGTITAASRGEGLGSCFTIRLKQHQPAAAAAAAPRDRRARPRRVLLIEDNADAREGLRVLLESAGHEVYASADCRHGLELLNVVHPDVGIIDVDVPGMDGYQVAERIRLDPIGRKMLLLALCDNAARQATVPRQWFDDHLMLPVDPDRLAHLLEAVAS